MSDRSDDQTTCRSDKLLQKIKMNVSYYTCNHVMTPAASLSHHTFNPKREFTAELSHDPRFALIPCGTTDGPVSPHLWKSAWRSAQFHCCHLRDDITEGREKKKHSQNQIENVTAVRFDWKSRSGRRTRPTLQEGKRLHGAF